MQTIINRVATVFRERISTEFMLREFEVQCANKCQNLSRQEFKHWLGVEVERDLIKKFVMRKLHYSILSDELTIYEVYDCIDQITEYIYRIYRPSYFMPVETRQENSMMDISEDEEEQTFEDEMVNVLQSMRNTDATVEDPTSVMMTAALENDMASALLFYEMMSTINLRRETIVPNRKFIIELEEEKEEEKEIDCYVCLEKFSNTNCIKQNCSHECCSTCLIKTINADKRPEALCAMCRTPIEKLIVKTTDLKNELDKIFK
jgi:hypothetical protein